MRNSLLCGHLCFCPVRAGNPLCFLAWNTSILEYAVKEVPKVLFNFPWYVVMVMMFSNTYEVKKWLKCSDFWTEGAELRGYSIGQQPGQMWVKVSGWVSEWLLVWCICGLLFLQDPVCTAKEETAIVSVTIQQTLRNLKLLSHEPCNGLFANSLQTVFNILIEERCEEFYHSPTSPLKLTTVRTSIVCALHCGYLWCILATQPGLTSIFRLG